MFAGELGNVKDDTARIDGLFLYAALEELRVLREFESYDYRHHPKYNQMVVLHLVDTSLPRAVYEKGLVGPVHDGLRFTWIKNTLNEQKLSIDRLDTAAGSLRSHLQLPPAGVRHHRGGGANSPAVPGVAELE
jgi:hypothetical protein